MPTDLSTISVDELHGYDGTFDVALSSVATDRRRR